MIGTDPDSLHSITKANLSKVFETNTFGPLLLVQALLPNILAGQQKIIGIVSSRVGSIGDNTSGGTYAYRASKAAVNAIGRNLAVELKGEGSGTMAKAPPPTLPRPGWREVPAPWPPLPGAF